MKKITTILAIALLAACGSEDGNSNGGNGGSGGGGGGPGEKAALTVRNDKGRTFVGDAMSISIEEVSANAIPIIFVDLATREDTDGDGTADSSAFYELQLRTSATMLENRKLESTGLFTTEPNAPGRGKIEVGFAEGNGEFGGTIDKIELNLSAGEVTGSVTSDFKPEVAATIEGSFTMACSRLEGGELVPDPTFQSDFCKRFSHNLSAD